MRIISEQELKDILDRHGKWLRNEESGQRADLSYSNLSYSDLSYSDLRGSDLSGSNLSGSNLSGSNLRYSDLVIFQFQQHQAFYTLDGTLRIGCLVMPITEWVLGYEEIGKAQGYSDLQIIAYGEFIETCIKMFKKEGVK